MERAIHCACGALQGELTTTATVNRGLCYCKDCQAFAHALQRAECTLDAQGGTDILQTSPQSVRIASGHEQLACLRLTPTGLLRWYARCCNTLIGNTPPSRTISFVGLIHTCFDRAALDSIALPAMQVWTQSARGEPKPRRRLALRGVLGLAGIVIGARFTGSYKSNPLFDANGQPIALPRVLGNDELQTLRAKVG